MLKRNRGCKLALCGGGGGGSNGGIQAAYAAKRTVSVAEIYTSICRLRLNNIVVRRQSQRCRRPIELKMATLGRQPFKRSVERQTARKSVQESTARLDQSIWMLFLLRGPSPLSVLAMLTVRDWFHLDGE